MTKDYHLLFKSLKAGLIKEEDLLDNDKIELVKRGYISYFQELETCFICKKEISNESKKIIYFTEFTGIRRINASHFGCFCKRIEKRFGCTLYEVLELFF